MLFSPVFFDVKIGGSSALKTALGITIILMSIVIFIFGNYRLLTEKEMKINNKKL